MLCISEVVPPCFQSLMARVEYGQIEGVRKMLSISGCLFPDIDPEMRILQRACAKNLTEIARLLLSYGDVRGTEDTAEYNALQEAVKNDNQELVQLLLKHNVSITLCRRRCGTTIRNWCSYC